MDHFDDVKCDPTWRIDRRSCMSSPNPTITEHLTSFVSFTFIVTNLVIWLPLLLLAALTRAVLPFGFVSKTTEKVVDAIYRLAVNIDAWWISRVLGIELELEDDLQVLAGLAPTESPVVICNHQSWFDIFLLQTLISGRGPILKFLIKVELLWVPVPGWVCLALNFPRLKRKGDAESRSKDLRSVESASLRLGTEPGGLLVFPEGTRFSQEKRDRSNSEHQHLLQPKSGGFTVIQRSMPEDTSVLDISIRYNRGDMNCWRCMSGAVDRIFVKVESFQMRDIQDATEWLNRRWAVKDSWVANSEKECGGTVIQSAPPSE
jgi:1-acyl-sn-glycerol-3-phosphate acyltransferase